MKEINCYIILFFTQTVKLILPHKNHSPGKKLSLYLLHPMYSADKGTDGFILSFSHPKFTQSTHNFLLSPRQLAKLGISPLFTVTPLIANGTSPISPPRPGQTPSSNLRLWKPHSGGCFRWKISPSCEMICHEKIESSIGGRCSLWAN